MGLDMYLERKNHPKDVKLKILNALDNTPESEQVAYWRKANQIHAWFDNKLNGIENCTDYKVSKEILQELINDCKAILDNHKLAMEIMPTQAGFFFGGTEYDTYYFSEIDDTIKVITKILEETDFDNQSIIYYASW